MAKATTTRVRTIVLCLLGIIVAALVGAMRYNDPEGAFGGLMDDHFFYVAQGWQMLFGEWPDRDYFEYGAPLTISLSAIVQVLLGRSVWSEHVLVVTLLAAGTGLASALAGRVSGSVVLGIAAAVFQLALRPRLYNYPKVFVYAVVLAALWAWVSSPTMRRTWIAAAVTVLAFLFRHDHGVYAGVAFVVLVVAAPGLSVLDRLRQFGIYVLTGLVLVSPYLGYLQLNGGIERHFIGAYRWSARDYTRAPRVLPDFEVKDVFAEVATDAPASEWWEHAPWVNLSDYSTWWLFWLFMALPVIGLLLVAVRPSNGPPDWPRERAMVLALIVLTACVDYGFIRGNLAGRLADVSVPVAVLLAWAVATVARIVRGGRLDVAGRGVTLGTVGRVLTGTLLVLFVLTTGVLLVRSFRTLVENSRVLEGVEGVRAGAELVTERLQHTWPFPSETPDRGVLGLVKYLQACTAPADRVLVSDFYPQIVGLAQRGFAGGHVDLRGGGFFGGEEEQRLTVSRLRAQSVPVVIGPRADDMREFSEDLSQVAGYLRSQYVNLGEKDLGDGLVFTLLVRRDARRTREYAPLGFPCFR